MCHIYLLKSLDKIIHFHNSIMNFWYDIQDTV